MFNIYLLTIFDAGSLSSTVSADTENPSHNGTTVSRFRKIGDCSYNVRTVFYAPDDESHF